MSGTRMRRTAAAACVLLLAVAASAAALGATGRAEKLRLSSELGLPEELLAYDGSRLLLLTSGEIVRIYRDGSLDPSFAGDGRLEIPFADVAVTPRGEILLATTSQSPSGGSDSDATVTRLLPDGNPDPSFGQGGTAYVDFGGYYDGVATLAIAADGKIVVGGRKQLGPESRGLSEAEPVVARLRPDGVVDRSFSRDGVRVLPGGWEAGVFEVARAPRGGIVALGEAFIGTEVWKLKPSGGLDRRFGKDGSVTLEGRGRRLEYEWEEELDVIPRIGVRPSGKVLLAAAGSRYDGDRGWRYRALALRLGTDGGIDRTYGRRGYARAGFRGWTFAQSVAFLPDGRVVVAGNVQVPIGKNSDVGIVVFDKRGHLDRRFGNRGRLRANLGGWDAALDLITQGRRAIVLGAPEGEDEPRTRWLVRAPLAGRRGG